MLIVVLLILINDWIAQIVPRLIIVSGWCTIQILDTNLHIFSPQNNSPPPKTSLLKSTIKKHPMSGSPTLLVFHKFWTNPTVLNHGMNPTFLWQKTPHVSGHWVGWPPLPAALKSGRADSAGNRHLDDGGCWPQLENRTDSGLVENQGARATSVFFLEIHKVTKCWIWSDFWEPYFWFLIYN